MNEYILQISWEKENSKYFNDLLRAQDRAIAKASRQLNEEKKAKKDILKRKKDWIRVEKEKKGSKM